MIGKDIILALSVRNVRLHFLRSVLAALGIVIGVVAIAIFMVSNIKYYSFKALNFFARKPFMSFVLIVFVLAVVIAEPQIMIFTFALGYSLSGPAWWLFRLTRRAYEGFRQRRTEATKTDCK